MTTPIERFKEAVESMDMECHWIGRIAQEVGPDLLALVETVEEFLIASHPRKAFEMPTTDWLELRQQKREEMHKALAKLKGEIDE